MKDREVSLRLIVVDPPADAVFALQRGRSEIHQPTRSSGGAISFDFTARVRAAGTAVTLLGPFVQGTPTARFVYVSSGTFAGDAGSCWSRRAKVPLSGITPLLIRQLEEAPGSRLEGRITGTAGDGGPACASVPLLGNGWCVVASGSRQRS